MGNFGGERMRGTPEENMGRQELHRRGKDLTLAEIGNTYARSAGEVLSKDDKGIVRSEISRFSEKILSQQGFEQQEQLQYLISALIQRKASVFDEVADDEHERAAFALELVRQYEKSLH
jgi:hypothetical protein